MRPSTLLPLLLAATGATALKLPADQSRDLCITACNNFAACIDITYTSEYWDGKCTFKVSEAGTQEERDDARNAWLAVHGTATATATATMTTAAGNATTTDETTATAAMTTDMVAMDAMTEDLEMVTVTSFTTYTPEWQTVVSSASEGA